VRPYAPNKARRAVEGTPAGTGGRPPIDGGITTHGESRTDRRPVGMNGQPLYGVNKVGNMDVQFDKSTSPDAINRFTAPVGRGSTFAERGMRDPKAPSYGAVPQSKRKEKKIRPPQSIGDMIRYKREIKERDANREYDDKTERTGILGKEASARTGLGTRKQARLEEQQSRKNQLVDEDRSLSAKDRSVSDALSNEYADPKTTPKRKLEIEREIAVRGGKQPTRPTSKYLGMTEKEQIDSDLKLSNWYEENKKKVGTFGSRVYETVEEVQQRVLGRQFGGAATQDTQAPQAAPSQMTPEGFKALSSGDIYIGSDGKKRRKP
jgi:hypothetical protein